MTEYFFFVKGKPITSEYLPIDENFYLTEQQEEIVSAMVNQDLNKTRTQNIHRLFWMESLSVRPRSSK